MRLFDGLSHKELFEWHKQLGRLTETLRSESFCASLCQTLGMVTNFQGAAIITYKTHHQPLFIYDSYSPQEHKRVVGSYLDGAYVLDPFYTALRRNISPGIYRLKEMAPDSFEQSEYYLKYYHSLHHIEDEVGIFIDLPDDVMMIISLGRSAGQESLTRNERNVLNSILPLIRGLVRQFWSLQAVKFAAGDETSDPVEQAFKTFGSGTLTERELEIICLILQGHSSKSVANTLGISPGTVKVHRKNIYTRLNISTQSQLFSLFLNHLAMEAQSG